ncbi:major facilitator superfamily transporter [Deinococcus aerius]|uniref:Major facilitator superfamily transporter n=1 Tax=Deinococcus aerius TaxID=200253 RepID=A0A2I9DWV9_9DEIO|nr:MFS transporter [Deinococcus aerius]GBF07547.1 major facilitator superfamily transporter [Deinococcus aerius]
MTDLPSLPPARIRRTMRLSTLEGSITQLFINWTTGSVLTGYLLHLGAGPKELALVASVPMLAQVVSPFAALLAARFGSRKGLSALFAALGRGLWILAALLPLLGLPYAWATPVLVALVAVSAVFQAACGSLWSAFMGDVVPDRERGRYFGLRTGVAGVVGMLGNLAAAVVLDRLAAPLNFQVVLGVGVLCALIGAVLVLLHDEPPMQRQRVELRATFTAPWRDRNFRRFLAFSTHWHFSVMLAGPFVFAYFLGQLHLSFTQIAVWSAIASSCALVTSWWWGRVADHVGNKPVLRFGTILAGVGLPGSWILAGLSGRVEFIWLSAVLDAVAWGAIGPALFNLALGSAPREGRTAFFAMFSLVSGLAGCVGGLIAGPLLGGFLAHPLTTSLFTWTGYHTLFALSGVARANSWLLLRRVGEPGEARLREGVRAVRVRGRAPVNAGD